MMKKQKIIKSGKEKLIFPTSMYNTVWGSILICAYMFSEQPVNTNNLRCKWIKEENKIINKKYSKLMDFSPADESFIDDVLDYFGMKRPEYFPIALIKGPYNSLFVPYDKETNQVLPLREDGVISRTYFDATKHSQVYPVVFNDILDVKE